MDTIETHYRRGCCILDKGGYKTEEEIETAFNDMTIYIENTTKGQSERTDKMLADAHMRRGNIYARKY